MKKEAARTLRAFAVELVIYSILVVAYFFLVLHFLGDELQRLGPPGQLEACGRHSDARDNHDDQGGIPAKPED